MAISLIVFTGGIALMPFETALEQQLLDVAVAQDDADTTRPPGRSARPQNGGLEVVLGPALQLHDDGAQDHGTAS